MKNNGITLTRGNNATSGRQNSFLNKIFGKNHLENFRCLNKNWRNGNLQRKFRTFLFKGLFAIGILDSPTIWISDKWTPSCFLMYWSCIRMVGLAHKSTIWIPNHLKSEHHKVQTSNVSGIQMVPYLELLFCQRTVGQLTPFKVQVEQSTIIDAKLLEQITSGTLN